ncbi:LysR family transcriptional regulator [Limosilactobacillus reuteri]|uniref:LysR family transcriptional regulator n=1 Tax=Limosilactobacillus reuteri TaxID=1598 RepID=UPI001E4C29BA|nr:LysR family transcriptional regulator [Limosilactobacillus reuteri]MCC4422541.1 LysR family transcriptional regulator [Limosilactobacillus reuteri]
MIDNYLLEYLVAFAQTGTIAGAAEQLNITQPTVSRGLKKLETLLDVKLFDRQPQKLSLTATGKFTAQRARILLQQQNDFKKAVQHFASKNDYLRIAGTIPGPLLLLENIIERLDNQLVIESKTILPSNIEPLLHNHNYALIFSTHEIQNTDIESRFIGMEKLAIKITKFNPLYHRSTVNFNDLNGHEFVLSDNIGEWRQIVEQYIPAAQFLYQAQPEALRELIRYSNFPIFKTNITNYLDEKLAIVDQKRKFIPINDPHSAIELYATYLKTDRQKITPLISEMTKILTQVSD